MHATLLSIPDSVREQLEQTLQEQGLLQGYTRLYANSLQELPRSLPEGLVVLGDPGRTMEEVVRLCRELHSRRNVLRTHLVVLTERPAQERGTLVLAGADECTPPPGGDWLARMTALARRAVALGLASSAPPLDALSTERDQLRGALQALMDSTLSDLGHHFFRNMVAHLARTFRVSCALVGEMLPEGDSIRTLALWLRGGPQENVVYSLRGTPCDDAIRNSICHLEDGVAQAFPEDEMLSELSMRGYLGAPLKDTHGRAIGILALLHDEPLVAGALEQTLLAAFAARAGAELERIRAQEELERTRDFLRNTLDAVPDPLFVEDRAHRWVAVNRAFCQFMGRTEMELLGSSVRQLRPEHEAASFWAEDERVFTTGEPSEAEEAVLDGAGQSRRLVTKKASFTDSSGQPFLVATIRDITERRRLEVQLRLADRMASVGMLATGVAHEINNPLAYVCSNLAFMDKLVAQPQVPPEELPELREVVKETREGIDRVRTIVQDLKAFARADEDRMGPMDLHAVIEGAVRLVRKELQYRAHLVRELEPVPRVRGNEGRLGQVLVNLLVNALQAFPNNEPSRHRVRVRVQRRGDGTVGVEVEDNGPGMSAEVRQRIFDPFFTTKPVGEGTGLGLAICQSILQDMGGHIEVESELGRGSLFRLVLPECEAEEVAEARAPQAPLEEEGPRRRLLLIDTEPAVGSSVRRLLQEAHEVEAVQDVGVAFQLLSRGERYDAILCDTVLPGMSGGDFLRELELHAPGLSRRTGFMSSGTFSPQAREFLGAHQGDLLEKPFDPERLRRFVQRLLA